MWKGGRLRLEKAKEHYMVRLRREWAEDTELSSDSRNFDGDAVGSMHSSEKLVKDHSLENMQLKIFFPKLRKVQHLFHLIYTLALGNFNSLDWPWLT